MALYKFLSHSYDYVQGAVASSETSLQPQSILQMVKQVEDQSKALQVQL